ncbi:MAG: alpha/beta fold hydrolase [Acidobacteriota bacterium]
MTTPRSLPRLARPLLLILPFLAAPFLGCGGSPEPAADGGGVSTDGDAPASTPASIELFEESLDLEDGGTRSYDRGVLKAPLRRDQPSGPSVDVEFFRFRRDAEASPDTPPLVILHGGPGYEGLAPRLADTGYFEDRLTRYTRITDVIVPGQRGFGSSTPTPCEPSRQLTRDEAQDPPTRSRAIQDAARACRQKWRDAGLDPFGFNVLEASADVADIVRLLGYGKVQLRGVSFGSHWGMSVIRHHPEIVDRAVLASLEGPDHTYDMPSAVLATLERIAAAAEASPALADRIPEGGFLEAYRRLIERAEKEPIAVEVEDPVEGSPVEISLGPGDLRQMLAGTRGLVFFRFRMPRWPLVLLDMLEGDLTEAADRHLWNLMSTDFEDAAYLQYDCGSGLSAARGEVLRRDPAASTLGPTWSRLDNFCRGWDGDLGEAFRSPFTTEVPTVLVQGTWDIGTPYENALELRPYFANHHFVTVEGGSHGAIREALEDSPAFREAMDRWLATGDGAKIPETVELTPVKWRG